MKVGLLYFLHEVWLVNFFLMNHDLNFCYLWIMIEKDDKIFSCPCGWIFSFKPDPWMKSCGLWTILVCVINFLLFQEPNSEDEWLCKQVRKVEGESFCLRICFFYFNLKRDHLQFHMNLSFGLLFLMCEKAEYFYF